jgi:vanillate O-demethylase ferredoxin subunit
MRFSLHWSEARIAATADLTPSIRRIEIAPVHGHSEQWRPGAHIDVGVMVGERPGTRSYSLVGRPEAGLYRIAVQRAPDGHGGSVSMHGLKPGQAIRISNPQNLFEIDWRAPEVLLVAGGIGITPILGMAEAIAAHGTPVRLAYCGRRRADMVFVEELELRHGDRLSLHVSEEGSRIDLHAALAALGPEAACYVCGPMRLLDAVRAAWAEARRPPTRLHFETFGSSGHFAAEPFEVVVPRHGVRLTVGAGETLLQALRGAGIDVLSDCERGECGLCALDVVESEGTIDHRDVFFSAAEKAHGDKLCACVSRAIGGVLVLDTAYRTDIG